MMVDIQQSYPWLQNSLNQLSQYLTQGRIPQALLLVGRKGLGKYLLAEYFAQSLMCTDRKADGVFCGDCQSCTLFKAKTHPDYFEIIPEAEGKIIGIDVIRQLTVKLSLKPQFESYRIVIINPADSLNNASANAFLKYLEEPTERTCIILITDKQAKLTATIRSRCQKLLIAAPDKKTFNDWLLQQGIQDKQDVLLSLTGGSPLQARQLSDDSVLQLRVKCFNDWVALTEKKENFIALAEQWQKLGKSEIDFLIFWLISWVVDMIKLNYDQADKTLFNPDFARNLQELTKQLNLKGLYEYYDFLLLSQQRLDTQLNKQLMFEEILIKWSKLKSR